MNTKEKKFKLSKNKLELPQFTNFNVHMESEMKLTDVQKVNFEMEKKTLLLQLLGYEDDK